MIQEMQFKDIFIQQSGIVCAILEEDIRRIHLTLSFISRIFFLKISLFSALVLFV